MICPTCATTACSTAATYTTAAELSTTKQSAAELSATTFRRKREIQEDPDPCDHPCRSGDRGVGGAFREAGDPRE